MTYPFGQVIVFHDPDFHCKGNTATVVLLDHEMTSSSMQRIAEEFQQPATTFLWPADVKNSYHVRWFAPDAEIELCGHGSLAAIAYLRAETGPDIIPVSLHYKRGTIKVWKTKNEDYTISLAPISVIEEITPPDGLAEALGLSIEGYFSTNDKYIVLVKDATSVINMQPDFVALRKFDVFAYAVTARGSETDFVSRTFVPHVQQLEDPATGSSHAALAPFWANIIQKNTLTALQCSQRGGFFHCNVSNGQVTLTGKGHVFANGNVTPLI